jgi:hypothetical protein
MPEILIPRSAAERKRYLLCFCGKAFPLDQKVQFVRHCKACGKRHGEEIEERAKRRKANAFMSPSDVELFHHIRKGGS